jgi:hypothetical protein
MTWDDVGFGNRSYYKLIVTKKYAMESIKTMDFQLD